MKTEPITIVCQIKARPETKGKVRAMLRNLVQMTRLEKGNLNYFLHGSESDDGLFIIYENWENQAALDHHMAASYLKEFLSVQDELLEKPIAGEICRIIE